MPYWEKLLHEVQNKNHKHKYSFNPAYESIGPTKRREQKICKYFLDENKELYLTHREAGCLYYIYQDYTIKATAKKLDLSHRTVEFYLKRIKHKLKCNNRNELLVLLQQYDFMAKIAHVDF